MNIEFYQIQDAWKTLSNPSRRYSPYSSPSCGLDDACSRLQAQSCARRIFVCIVIPDLHGFGLSDQSIRFPNKLRFLYDMRTFGSSTEFPECDESYLLDLEKAQAEKDLVSMSSYLQKVVRRETKAKGVVVMDAW